MSANVPLGPFTRPPALPTTMLPSGFVKAGVATVVDTPAALRKTICSRSLRRAATEPLKLPSAFGVSVVTAPVWRFVISTSPSGSIAPWLPETIDELDEPGMLAETTPAAGGGGGVRSIVVNRAPAAAASGRPFASRSE